MLELQTKADIVVAQAADLTIAHTLPSDNNPAQVYLAGLATGSRRTMREALDTIARLFSPTLDYASMPWHGLRYQHTQAVRSKLSENYSASTANKMLSALRGTLKEAWRLGLVDAESYQRAVDLKNVAAEKAQQSEKGRHLSQGELSALIGACMDGTKTGARDAAMIAIAYAAGLRRAEIAGLQLADYDADLLQITVQSGKRNKQRVIPLNQGACDAVNDWLTIRGSWAGALFTRIRKGDSLTIDGLTDQAIYVVLNARAGQAKVKAFSPHDMRRTFIGDILDSGGDLSVAQKLAGHSSSSTTAGYDRRGIRAKRDATNRLHVPYQKIGA